MYKKSSEPLEGSDNADRFLWLSRLAEILVEEGKPELVPSEIAFRVLGWHHFGQKLEGRP